MKLTSYNTIQIIDGKLTTVSRPCVIDDQGNFHEVADALKQSTIEDLQAALAARRARLEAGKQ